MDKPWERPHSHEEDLLEADLRIDRWTLDVLRAIGQAVVVIADDVVTLHRTVNGIQKSQVILAKGNTKIMAALDTIKDALAVAKSDALAEHEEVMTALADATTALAALQAKVDELTAGAVSQAEIDAVAADATAVDEAIKSIYTAPVVEPPPA